jgi:hypothetical protein
MFFLLKRIVCIALLLTSFNELAAQDYIGFSRRDILLIKGNNFSESSVSFLRYDFPNVIFLGKSVEGGFESFNFDKNEQVYRYIKYGLFKDDEILKIIKGNNNNSNYKRVDVGDKQNFFQWIDSEQNIDIKLTANPMEEYFLILYEVFKKSF